MIPVEEIERAVLEELEKVSALHQLQEIKAKYLGKKGVLTQALKELPSLPAEERKVVGASLNRLKEKLEHLFRQREEELKIRQWEEELRKEWYDLTVPPTSYLGGLHPITLTIRRIRDILTSMGFEVKSGPEVELEAYNFDMLNIPPYHPARDMQDTFYLDKEGYLLRTHTSPVQVRVMLEQEPPIKMIAYGKVYRRDDDPTHSPMFHQVEGLVIDRDVSFGHMKYTIETFLKSFFGEDLPVRFRASYFPFTEPSAEVDIGCSVCGGTGCRVCKGSGWLEVMGCGMVHPQVLRNCGIDPDVYQGFAFGMGVERLAMIYYRVDNIKLFYENDLRFLRQLRWI
ncbi:phenylalanyl-tRNA synthetase, alpha subunit [Thermocrinis albus DSM 14484]|uniref:Phenylalanine--tRNA ligase alpha subunit n=1 Tax=Thermocrinis albus (strain DSM 14484 / JCM 11386 / HI 11/12) TaxID=638303 RepID=D3SN50_THEAH|nr:phenylalanine--tRNA ligase subunit alpha [Thermocrinis albus]ADC90180.1 phenylalanyl-tRNA synthetase, alpha subunit [Thermocrinis albus DSM 14484]